MQDLLAFHVLLQPGVFMRAEALRQAGYLQDKYHMILDHSLWIKIAARSPILHIDEFWSVERTHPEAKTIAQAMKFVEEAFQYVAGLEKDPAFEPLFRQYRAQIYAGLNVFAGRRAIDAGLPARALNYFRQAYRYSPAAVWRVWFKVIQAAGGAIGLEKLFLAYRSSRRSLQHGAKRLRVDSNGVRWEEPASP